jgi:hypothetical protein
LNPGLLSFTIPGKADVFIDPVWIEKYSANDRWLEKIVGQMEEDEHSTDTRRRGHHGMRNFGNGHI